LVATNSMTAALQSSDETSLPSSEPYQAAELAAIKLLDSLGAMRAKLEKSSGLGRGSKRKHLDISSSSRDIWNEIQSSDAAAKPARQATLEKWNAKVRGATGITVSQKLNPISQQTIVQVLEDQLADTDRLVKRTNMPRSCAPVQAKAKTTEDVHIYDDADFYQMMLKELIDQRMLDPAATSGGGVETAGERPAAQWTAVREARTKNSVDTKASKGRKMKFTVHEKLQNFMAPEDRCTWEQEAVDRFFGPLLGQRVTLGEDASDSDPDAEEVAEAALMMFRS
jgi:protein AATF/BFR2